MIVDRVVYMRVLIIITPVYTHQGYFSARRVVIDFKLEFTDHRVGYARK